MTGANSSSALHRMLFVRRNDEFALARTTQIQRVLSCTPTWLLLQRNLTRSQEILLHDIAQRLLRTGLVHPLRLIAVVVEVVT